MKCHVCLHSIEQRRAILKKDHLKLIECEHCRFVFADPSEWKNPYTDKDYYDQSLQILPDYPIKVSLTDLDRMKSISRFITGGTLLDFGGGCGSTALAASQNGFKCTVIESSSIAINNGQKYHPEINWIKADKIPVELDHYSFDAITLFHVLEHLPDPNQILSELHQHLTPHGYLCIEVPNWGSHMRRIKKADWIYTIPHHVNYFTSNTLAHMLNRHGFSTVLTEYRRTFAINEKHPYREHFKKVLCKLGFGDVLRMTFKKL